MGITSHANTGLGAALSEAAQAVLRPLVRILLRNGVAYGAFAELTRRVYAEVAEREFALAGRKQTVSRISTLTGLTRKEVTRIQSEEGPSQADNERYNRPARVISGWVREKRYHDRRGRPAELQMEGDARSFSALVREFSGDIPPRAMADELARVGAIEIMPDGKVRLLTRAYIPRGDQVEKLGILGADVADLIRTIDHNLTCAPGEAYFQRRVSYDNIPREMLPTLTKQLSRKAQSCLESMDRVLAAADRDRSPAVKGTGRARTGVGIYYFEEPAQ
ncbi:MAG TPA: DUF6502 family protein [Burkholderiales bacterium]|jgi:hypothetical protein|nr:DUF6502 family protein [Burkholderiales bacterium]